MKGVGRRGEQSEGGWEEGNNYTHKSAGRPRQTDRRTGGQTYRQTNGSTDQTTDRGGGSGKIKQ